VPQLIFLNAASISRINLSLGIRAHVFCYSLHQHAGSVPRRIIGHIRDIVLRLLSIGVGLTLESVGNHVSMQYELIPSIRVLYLVPTIDAFSHGQDIGAGSGGTTYDLESIRSASRLVLYCVTHQYRQDCMVARGESRRAARTDV